jgi:phage replication-related protein YjqB (UPF0714/DUF867 family)
MLLKAIEAKLAEAGFTTGVHPDTSLQGMSLSNICNKGKRKRGVELEIGPDLRDAIRVAAGAPRPNRLAECIRAAISEAN